LLNRFEQSIPRKAVLGTNEQVRLVPWNGCKPQEGIRLQLCLSDVGVPYRIRRNADATEGLVGKQCVERIVSSQGVQPRRFQPHRVEPLPD
jgi:hypothetical protein